VRIAWQAQASGCKLRGQKERIKEPDAPWRRTVFVVAAARRKLVRLEIGLEGA
jgi:hypothetical protein